jgi:hypothetical protein
MARRSKFAKRITLLPLWVAILSTVALDGCQLATSPNSSQEFAPQAFPVAAGDHWQYVIYDSAWDSDGQLTSARVESLSVTIENTRVLPDSQSLGIWIYSYSGIIDTVLVQASHDTVYMRNAFRVFSLPILKMDATYLFPLSVGKSWGSTYALGGDTSEVLGEGYLSTPAGSFPKAAHVRRHYYTIGPISSFAVDSWYVPYYGFVKFTQTEGFGTLYTVSIELVRYKLGMLTHD